MADSTPSPWQPHLGLTLFGRKPALEALADSTLPIHCVHLAKSNRAGGIIAEIARLAEQRGITIRYHDKQALSRISKNGRQDQGVALDVVCPQFRRAEDVASDNSTSAMLLALDGVINPQNVGMILRSAVAAGIDGVLYPKRGVAALGPLVIKASAGTVFRAPILHCNSLTEGLAVLASAGYQILTLDAAAPLSLYDFTPAPRTVFVLGGESEGISHAVQTIANESVSIPMFNGVESLNVAITAALVAFHLTAVTGPTRSVFTRR